MITIIGCAFEKWGSLSNSSSDCSCRHIMIRLDNYQNLFAILFILLMSKKSGSSSSNGSAASLERCVEQILIESDQQEKNMRKLTYLRTQFPVLRKINNSMTNNDKLQLFLKDNHFRQKIIEKMNENKIRLQEGNPVLKVYFVSTVFKNKIEQQFDEADLIYIFQKFGFINQIFVSEKFSFILYQQIISVFLAQKILNQFPINESIRLRVRICNQEQSNHAHSIFYKKSRGAGLRYEPSPHLPNFTNRSNQGILKYIVKFQFGVESLPQFNIAQRIIGPKGSYMKRIIENILNKHPLAHKYNLSNIDSVFKMRIMGKGSGYQQQSRQQLQKLHLFISSKQKWMYEAACQQVQNLLIKVFQDYKVQFQKLYKMHSSGVAYKILQYEGSSFYEVRRVVLEEIEETVDLLSLSGQQKLPQKIIIQKIKQRDHARKNGKFQEADQVRSWLKARGVVLVDSKFKRGKTVWNYIQL